MSNYIQTGDAKTFDPATDSDRPIVGETISNEDGVFRVVHVEAIAASRLMQDFMKGVEQDEGVMNPALFNADTCVAREHETRPFVQWLCWADKVEG